VKRRRVKVVDPMEIDAEKARLSVLCAIAIGDAKRKAGLKNMDLARRLGIPPSRVTKVLDGMTNMTLKTLAEFGLACGVHWTIEVLKLEKQKKTKKLPRG